MTYPGTLLLTPHSLPPWGSEVRGVPVWLPPPSWSMAARLCLQWRGLGGVVYQEGLEWRPDGTICPKCSVSSTPSTLAPTRPVPIPLSSPTGLPRPRPSIQGAHSDAPSVSEPHLSSRPCAPTPSPPTRSSHTPALSHCDRPPPSPADPSLPQDPSQREPPPAPALPLAQGSFRERGSCAPHASLPTGFLGEHRGRGVCPSSLAVSSGPSHG